MLYKADSIERRGLVPKLERPSTKIHMNAVPTAGFQLPYMPNLISTLELASHEKRWLLWLLASLPVAILATNAFGRFLRQNFFVPKYTILADLPVVGTPRKDERTIGKQAVICGGR